MSENPLESIVRAVLRRLYHRRVSQGDHSHPDPLDRAWGTLMARTGVDRVFAWQNQRDTLAILDRFPEVLPADIAEPERPLIPPELRSEWMREFMALAERTQRRQPRATPMQPAFTVAIPFYGHLGFLQACLSSVARAMKKTPQVPLEIVLVNDDPAVGLKQLAVAVPSPLRRHARIFQNPANLGICATLNKAVREARYPWIVHLDCDDLLPANCLRVLQRRIRQYPRARYISTRMLDIDAQGRLLRARLRDERPSHLIMRGMVAGHLKVIRRDLFDDIGPYQQRYAGCQDYEFALRASLVEPLLFVPDYLYAYRWHGRTQSVAQARRQDRIAGAIIDTYLLAGRMLTSRRPPRPLQFQGPESETWQRRFPLHRNYAVAPIELFTQRPCTTLNQTLLAVAVAQHVITHRDADIISPLRF
ncbi:glycosyltransferase family 2 protein [Desulfatitalea alkaliphila]|uniref:Glycosyltransferase n=1 Tax=Desulfatitalea alkaliphila TaxID=2929485 RepID=A0AA41UHA2_9BACT|nr:glycosyltransferase [Desulfatitalea alkaliphila]MCJ8499395.1 glycosyltransferase [Desulfatitalea alkaliphila]